MYPYNPLSIVTGRRLSATQSDRLTETSAERRNSQDFGEARTLGTRRNSTQERLLMKTKFSLNAIPRTITEDTFAVDELDVRVPRLNSHARDLGSSGVCS